MRIQSYIHRFLSVAAPPVRLLYISGSAVVLIACGSAAASGETTPTPLTIESEVRAAERIDSFDECVAAGNPVMKTQPPRCITSDKRVFFPKLETIPGPGESVCKDRCGDGECQEVVCTAVGCPCAETAQSCPQDCE